MSGKSRLVVMASGSGSNLQAIIHACADDDLPAEVVAVISDHEDAYALERARTAGIPARTQTWAQYRLKEQDREKYDADLAKLASSFQPDLIILAGWMRLLSMAFLSHFPMRVINLHPALPGTFPGTHAIERAFKAYQAGEISETGVMVHFVPDEGVDDGPLIATQIVPIHDRDTLQTLTERIHQVEHKLLVSAIKVVVDTNLGA